MKNEMQLSTERANHYKCLERLDAGLLTGEELRVLHPDLIHRSLIRWLPSGELALTEKGRQFLFQFDCERTLRILVDTNTSSVSQPAGDWLVSQRFALAPTKSEIYWRATPHGRSWLQTLAPWSSDEMAASGPSSEHAACNS